MTESEPNPKESSTFFSPTSKHHNWNVTKRDVSKIDYNKPQKVKILEASFDPSTDMVVWVLELPNGDNYPMAWARTESEKVLNVKGNIPPAMLQEFNLRMIGKELNLIIKPPVKEAPKKKKKKRKKRKKRKKKQ